MAQTEEFMFQNVAYRPTVYKTGVPPMNHKKEKYVTFDFLCRKIRNERQKLTRISLA